MENVREFSFKISFSLLFVLKVVVLSLLVFGIVSFSAFEIQAIAGVFLCKVLIKEYLQRKGNNNTEV